MSRSHQAQRAGWDVPGQDSFLGRAARLLEARRFAAAEATCKAILAHDPGQAEAQQMLGMALGAQGTASEAARWLDRAARARPMRRHPCHDLACLLRDLGLLGAIAPQYRACLRLAPRDLSLCASLAEQLRADGDVEAALEALRPVRLAATPPLSALMLVGCILADLGRFEEAADSFRVVVARDPAAAVAWSNLGVVLNVLGCFDAAIAAADRAMALASADPQVRLNRAMTMLRAGRLAQAWDDYDARLEMPGHTSLPAGRRLRDIAQIDAGARPIVLLTHDRGCGDTLHSIRYAAQLAQRGARVVAWMPAPLAALLARVPGVAETVPADLPAPAYDLHCPAADLPRVCRADIDSISGAPYLCADRAAIAGWARRLRPCAGARVGVAWAGQARPWLPGGDALDRRRNMALADLAPLGRVGGVTWVSLQQGPPARQAADPPPGLHLVDIAAAPADFADVAALVANLDAVVTVDSAIAHLAGGMGAQVLLLDSYDGCWRWFHGRADSPWYAGLRIFRQDRPGDWGPVVLRAADALEELLRSGEGSHPPARDRVRGSSGS